MYCVDWTEVSGIAASVAAVATLIGAGAAIAALIFARRAVREAKRQAEASIQAAKAALEQVPLMKEQLVLSQPKPVLLLHCKWTVRTQSTPIFELENVGEDLAFDAQVGKIPLPQQNPQGSSILSFLREPIVRVKERVTLRYNIHPSMRGRENERYLPAPDLRAFLEELVSVSTASASNLGYDPKSQTLAARVPLAYNNSRGRPFSGIFGLYVIDGNNIECGPEGSLVNPS
jgi:hypothetical protein